jgi:hypothetical protein
MNNTIIKNRYLLFIIVFLILVMPPLFIQVEFVSGQSNDYQSYDGNIRFSLSGVTFVGATEYFEGGIYHSDYDFLTEPYTAIQIRAQALTNMSLEYVGSQKSLEISSVYGAYFFQQDIGEQRDLTVSAAFDADPLGTGVANSYDVLIEFWYSKGQTGLGQSGQIHLNIKVEDTETPLPTSSIDVTNGPTLSASPTYSSGQIQPSQYFEFPFSPLTLLIVVVLLVIVVLVAVGVWVWQSGQKSNKSNPYHGSPPFPPGNLPPPPPESYVNWLGPNPRPPSYAESQFERPIIVDDTHREKKL